MSNPVLDAIAERRSIRSFKSDAITKEQLDILLKAAEQAPSARNAQPWHFSVVQSRALLDDINAEVKKNFDREINDIFYAAPAAIFISCDPEARWGRHDCGIAVQNIALAAHSIGLGSVILGMPEFAFNGPRGKYFSELLKHPDGYTFAVSIAIGVPAASKDAHPIEPGRISFIDA